MNVLTAMQQNGGNALGLEPSDGPLTLVQLTVTWDSAELDDLVEDEMSKVIDKVKAMAEERGESKGFVYEIRGQHAEGVEKVWPRKLWETEGCGGEV